MDGSGHRRAGTRIGDDRKPGIEGGREAQRRAPEFGFIQREERAFRGGDHLALGGCNQRVVTPDAFFGDARAADDREVGMDLIEGFFTQRPDQRAESPIKRAAGDGGFDIADVAEETRDREASW